MKVIDLFYKYINDEEMPKKIKVDNKTFIYRYFDYVLESDFAVSLFATYNLNILKEDVEIMEEPTTCEYFAKIFQGNCKLFQAKEKKIPEKLSWKPKESMAGELTQKEKIEVIARRTEKLKKEFNNLLDHLKSKGE